MARADQPDRDTMCHRTGFAKSCYECVTQHGCRLWQHVTMEGDPNTPPGHAIAPVDRYDCVDALMDLYMKDMLRRQFQTTRTVDKLANEVKDANDQGMGSALLGINHEIRRQTQMLAGGAAAPKQLTNGHQNGPEGDHAQHEAGEQKHQG